MKSTRLPRRIHLGLSYTVEVVLASQTIIRDIMELDDDDRSRFDGCWVSHLGDNTYKGQFIVAGVIYVDRSLSAVSRMNTYWHELGHALIDIRDFSLGL